MDWKRWLITIGTISSLSLIGAILLFVHKMNIPEPQIISASQSAAPKENTSRTKLRLQAQETMTPSGSKNSKTQINTGKVNINTASKTELEKLSGIGPALAERIIEYRMKKPFMTISDIKNVSGIGDKTFEKLKDQIGV